MQDSVGYGATPDATTAPEVDEPLADEPSKTFEPNAIPESAPDVPAPGIDSQPSTGPPAEEDASEPTVPDVPATDAVPPVATPDLPEDSSSTGPAETESDFESFFPDAPSESSGEPATEPPSTAPEDETPAAPPESSPEATPGARDLFDASALPRILDEPGSWTAAAARRWTDDSGRHGCDAWIERVAERHVILMRVDGVEVAVPYAELSDLDLHFLKRQIEARRRQLATDAEFVSTEIR